METVIIIPARYESSRFPGKPLALIQGLPMIGQVILRARKIPGISRVVVATDDLRIAESAIAFKAEIVMTRQDHRSGTDRVAEAAGQMHLSAETLIVNIQGDQPLLPVESVSDLIFRHQTHPEWPMSTLIYRITNPAEIPDPKHVKTVFDHSGKALYFSRSPIPCYRDGDENQSYYKHLGIYAYTMTFLQTFARLPSGLLESAEKLEQLRALESGYPIQVIESPQDSFEVDTPADLHFCT
ncbi:MAG: 3-deoxy-manno-octulosonate cytidylyltransferase [Deltaproteobacteria bacterium]|nr:3-deoxy-manno-octulosonate cytidylyltransferase [Deltaproteobacteria bacterium]